MKRNPRIEELDRLELRQVRPLVTIGQDSVALVVGPDQTPITLALRWAARTGGTFGTASSAAANALRGASSAERFRRQLEPDTTTTTDRGGNVAWHLSLVCPECSRSCIRLYSPIAQHHYACPKCTRPNYYPTTRPGVSERRRRQQLAHEAAAAKILQQYLGHHGPAPGLFRPAAIAKPRAMTWLRFEALCRLLEAHQVLAVMAELEGMQNRLARFVPGVADAQPPEQATRWARAVLRMDAWALRQRSWHRRGKPRDTPGQATREAAKKSSQNGVSGALSYAEAI